MGTKMVICMEPEWEPEWEREWEFGWEPEGTWIEPEWEPAWDQTGTKLGPKGRPWELHGWSLEIPGRSLGTAWGGPLGTKLGPRTDPAPVRHRGVKKCLKCITVVKNRWGDKRTGSGRAQILGPPGDSLK